MKHTAMLIIYSSLHSCFLSVSPLKLVMQVHHGSKYIVIYTSNQLGLHDLNVSFFTLMTIDIALHFSLKAS